MKRWLIVSLLFACALVIVQAQPKRIRVPQDQPTVQAGINSAVNGDTVLVAEGTYSVNLLITKKIVLGSLYIIDGDTSHISKTILDGGTPSNPDSASVIHLTTGTDSMTVISGFMIRNGRGTRTYDPSIGDYWRRGGGINLDGNGGTIVYNRIIDNLISGTYYGAAAAIAAWDVYTSENSKYIIIEHNTIARNSIEGYYAEGGALALGMSGRILNNTIIDNHANGTISDAYGGGISIWGNSNILIANNIIAKNTCSYEAGAMVIYALSGRAPVIRLVNNTICFNSAGQGVEGIWGEGVLRVMNTILWNPGDGPDIVDMGSTGFANNIIRGGYYGNDNIGADPLFSDLQRYTLSSGSPAVGRGVPSGFLDGLTLTAPETDLLGHVRPEPGGSSSDLGAIESAFGQVVTVDLQPAHISRTIGTRNVRIFLPRAYAKTSTSFPLFIFLHGSNGGSTNGMESGFHDIADSMNFIVASPKSLEGGWESSSETAYLESLIDSLAAAYNINNTAIFVGGYSSGGFMAYRFGLETTKKIKGIASVAGLLPLSAASTAPASPAALISFHSLSDQRVSYYGRPGYYRAESSISRWLSYFGCGSGLDTVTLNDPFPGNSNIVQRMSSRCAPVVFYKIDQGSHAWPGPYATNHRPTIPDVNASLEIMKFFHSLLTTSAVNEITGILPVRIDLSQNYPNPFNPKTNFEFSIVNFGLVKLSVFDLLGREVAVLVNEEKPAGTYMATWDARAFPSGVYFYRLNAGKFVDG
ncbi:MAG: Esterase depolymerase [Bacteroidetes bacterium]|nr:Esterase depolymerase [Bacteroidota bacterium]